MNKRLKYLFGHQVKLVKCLVDNIVVDISFQSLGGLCTVNFLESTDRRLDKNHLFKRSIILVTPSLRPVAPSLIHTFWNQRLLSSNQSLIQLGLKDIKLK